METSRRQESFELLLKQWTFFLCFLINYQFVLEHIKVSVMLPWKVFPSRNGTNYSTIFLMLFQSFCWREESLRAVMHCSSIIKHKMIFYALKLLACLPRERNLSVKCFAAFHWPKVNRPVQTIGTVMHKSWKSYTFTCSVMLQTMLDFSNQRICRCSFITCLVLWVKRLRQKYMALATSKTIFHRWFSCHLILLKISFILHRKWVYEFFGCERFENYFYLIPIPAAINLGDCEQELNFNLYIVFK